MSYTLFYFPHTASFTVHWLLLELGVRYNLHLVDFDKSAQKSDEYLAINPMGRVPALAIEETDGRKETYTEQAALLLILAERHPETGLFPKLGEDKRDKAVELLFYLSTNLLPASRDYVYAAKDPSDPADGPAVKRLASKRLARIWKYLDDHLDGKRYMLGQEEADLSILDFLVVAMLTWSSGTHTGALEAGKGNLRRLADRMVKRESWKKVLDKEEVDSLSDWPAQATS